MTSSESGRTSKAAGFAEVAVDAVDARSRAPSARHVAVAYCQGTPLRNEIEARDASRLEEATDRAADAVAQRFGAGGRRWPDPRHRDHCVVERSSSLSA